MKIRRSLRAKLLFGFALPVAFMSLLTQLTRQSLDSSVTATQSVANTDATIDGAVGLLLLIVSAQSGERGFLLTRDPAFLIHYDRAMAQFGRRAAELRLRVLNDPVQLSEVDHIVELFERWRSEAATPLVRRYSADPEAKRARELPEPIGSDGLHIIGHGLALSSEILTAVDTFVARERTRLAERTQASVRTVTQGKLLAQYGPLVGSALALLGCLLLTRHLLRGIDAVSKAAREIASGNLDSRASVQSQDEIGGLATVFNEMADRLRERTEERRLVTGLVETLNSCVNLSEAFAALSASGPSLFPGSSGAVYLLRASRDLLIRNASWGEHADQFDEHHEASSCWAIRRGKLYFAGHDGRLCHCQHIQTRPSHVAICIPLLSHSEALGSFQLLVASDQLTDAALTYAQTVSDQIALALTGLHIRDRLRDQSIRDALTGLFNRRCLEETLVREMGRAEKTKGSLGVIMVDLDHFKRLNDTFGHEAGDMVLREVARTLRASFRGNDIACRYGGEEFTVVMPDTTPADVMRRSERLCRRIRRLSLSFRGLPLSQVTVSVGGATFPHHGTTSDALLRAADAALYTAKMQGRDRVIMAEGPQATTTCSDLPPSLAPGESPESDARLRLDGTYDSDSISCSYSGSLRPTSKDAWG